MLAQRALLLALRGRVDEAEAKIEALLPHARPGRGYHHVTHAAADIYALQGKTEEAVRWLRKTAETGLPNYPMFARDPYLDRIRREPSFIAFMADLKTRWEGYAREFN